MRAIAALLWAAPLVLAGCMEEGPVQAGTPVEVDDDYFEPTTATAAVGDTFTFANEGQRSHTVTVHRPPDAADSYVKDETLMPGEGTSLSFDQAGTYHIFCKFHGSIGNRMHMNVTVSA